MSTATLVFAAIQMRKKADRDHVIELRERLDEMRQQILDLTRRAEECERARDVLVRENFDLLRRFLTP